MQFLSHLVLRFLLHSLNDPENAPFLNDINQGRTPAEFAGEKDPYVSIINKAGEDYQASLDEIWHNVTCKRSVFLTLFPCVQAPARPVAFAGSGQALGGGGAAAAAGPVQAATVTFAVNESEPTTTIQIRLHDGTRIQQVFNHTHTVGDVYAWVSTATPNAQVKHPPARSLAATRWGQPPQKRLDSTALRRSIKKCPDCLTQLP